MSDRNYWHRLNRQRLSRRSMLSASAKAGVGAAGLALFGCGDDDDDDDGAVSQAPAGDAADQATDQVADQADDQTAPDGDAVEEQAAEDQAVADAGPIMGGQIRTMDEGDLASFDGFLTFGYRAFIHGQNSYPMLMRFDNGSHSPDMLDFSTTAFWLAESVEQPDDVTHTFTLKENAVWEDVAPTNGRRVTGEDVAFAYSGERYAGYPNRGVLLPHLTGDPVAPDERTVTFNLNKPVAPFLLYMAHHAGPYTMPPEVVEAEQTRQGMIAAGPFTVGGYQTGAKVTYLKNPNYFDSPKPYVDEVQFVFVSDDSAKAAAIRTGEINVVSRRITNNIVPDLKKDLPDATWWTYSDNVIGGATFVDLLRWPDPRFRQALNVAMDRDGMLNIFGSLEEGTWGSSMPLLAPFNIDSRPTDSPLHSFFAHDKQKARQLIDASGVAEEDLTDIPFAIPANDTYGPTWTEKALVVAANYQDVGIDVSIDLRPATEHYATTFRGTSNDGGFSATGSVQVIEPDELFRNMYIGDSPRSPIINGEEMFKDQRLTDLINDQLAATDVDDRIAIIGDLQMHLADMMYMMPDIYSANSFYSSPEITNSWMKASFTQAWAHEAMWFKA